MKQQYRVIGQAGHPIKPAQTINMVVSSTSEASAIKRVSEKIGIDNFFMIWITDPIAYPTTLAEIEQQALADWNAQRPTASPLALAQARGEL